MRQRLSFLRAVIAIAVMTSVVSAQADKEEPEKKTGITLKGKVTLDGDAPAARTITITKDPELCSAHGTKVNDVKIGKDKGVADVVVEITGIKEKDGISFQWNLPKDGFVIRQKDCGFAPNVLVIPNGKSVKVFNDDKVTHNVNTGAWNEMQAPDAPAVEKPVKGRKPIKVSCNIHSWMEAWIYPVQSPHFAVTNKDGEYEIRNIPPGKYRVKFWHAALKPVKERLTFEEDANMTKDVAMESFE